MRLQLQRLAVDRIEQAQAGRSPSVRRAASSGTNQFFSSTRIASRQP